MENERLNQIIERIARDHGVSVAEVRTDMAEAIHAGYTAEDPAARERFRKMFDGEEPSIEEFIARIALELHSRLDDAYYCGKDQEDLGMRDNLDYKAIGARVKALRSAQEYTQETLAEAVDVSTSFIGHIERGEKKCSLETMSRLAARLGTTLDYLVLGVENRCNQQSCQLYVRLRNAIEAYSDVPILSKREIFM